MNEQSYQQFLVDKINDEHTLAHLLQQELASQRKRIAELLKDLSILRKSQNDLKLRSKQMEEKMVELQMENRKLKDVKYQKVRESADKRKKQERNSEMDSKQIFKMYIDNTFPKYKGMIKKMLKLIFMIEDTQKQQPSQKIKFYRTIFEKGVKRFLDWLFPKANPNENKQQLAENIVNQWKKQESNQGNNLTKTNQNILKQASYIKQIQDLQAKLLVMKSNFNLMEGRLRTYQRSLSAKGAQFVAHLKKLIQSAPEMDEEAQEKVQATMALFKTVINLSKEKTQLLEQQRSILNQVPLVLGEPKSLIGGRKKAAPILKKNIFGYYQQPQFAGNYTLPTSTKHINNDKSTQTLSQDLCILTLHPVIMVTLIDGNIKPQRTRHNQQHYVKIKINEDKFVQSVVKQSLQPVWNQPFLLKDYDFPFIHVQLIHKSKGLRDYSLGSGKFSASSEEQKIVNVRKQKEFIGRVRFSLSYPKGNIFEFKITSASLQYLQARNVIKQQIIIKFPYNGVISLEFTMPQKVIYLEKSVIILENCQERLEVVIAKQELREYVSLQEFTTQGNKQVVILIENTYKVVIQGEVYLLICEDQEPQRISQQLIDGGKGKFFSVRAPPPIVTVTYDSLTLHSNIKFPLVFQLQDISNILRILKEMSNRQLKEETVDQIVNLGGFLKLSEFIKAPSKIYKVFVQTLQGEKVFLKHENNLFERLLKQIHLQVSYKQDQIQQISYNRKGRTNKQVLYKQFTIQSKELMLNHYKVFTRHFKRIGFIKFKLGYTIYDNQLQTEEKEKKQGREQPSVMKEGLYFLELEISSAHLNSKSSLSALCVKINEEIETKKVKGCHPVWNETYTLSFQIKDRIEVQISYKIIENSTFGQKIIYNGKFIIDERVLNLGAFLLKLDDKGQDCLHFGKVKLSEQLYHLAIDTIEAQIQEQADWIGKIDPYLIISSKNSQMLKTNYLDNIGSHPVWTGINRHIFVGKEKAENELIVSAKVYDYDLIGRDDYIGEVQFTEEMNTELAKGVKSQTLYGNIVKQDKICGSMKMKGTFQKVSQPKIKLRLPQVPKLSRKDLVYRVVLYDISFTNMKEMEGDSAKMILYIEGNKQNQLDFKLDEQSFKSFNWVRWGYKTEELTFEVQRQYKSYFKTYNQVLGKFSLKIHQRFFDYGHSELINSNGSITGKCKWFLQFQSSANYAVITDYMSCRPQGKLSSDIGDQLNLFHRSKQPEQPMFLFYQRSYVLAIKNHEEKQFNLNEQSEDKRSKFLSEDEGHKDVVAYLKIEKDIAFEGKLQQRSSIKKIEHDKNFKEIKYLHWQPFIFYKKNEFSIFACFQQNLQNLQVSQNLKTIYNQYIVLNKLQNSIIFEAKNMPEAIKIRNNVTKEEIELKLKENVSQVFLPNKGALYCQIQDYNQKSVLQLHFKYIFVRLKQLNINTEDQNVTLELLASNKQSIKASPIFQRNCFVFENVDLYIKEPSTANVIFFQANISTTSLKTAKTKTLKTFKFGIRLQPNKTQYRFLDLAQAFIHTQFECWIIQRKYEELKAIDNTKYGMSFIRVKKIQFQINEQASEKQVYLEMTISNQHQKIVLEKNKGSNVYTKESQSIFYIQKYVICEVTIVQVGILSNKVLGKATIQISEALITKKLVILKEQVKLKNQIIGRLQLIYQNIEEIDFIDANFFTSISRYQDMGMTAELHQFGPGKQKYQELKLTSKGNIQRLESEDSFIIVGDLRNYQVNVFQTDTRKLLGEFKLCHQLQLQNKANATVVQPLRTNSESLNGVLIIQYLKKQTNKITYEQNKDKVVGLVKLTISNIIQSETKPNEEISMRIKTWARSNTSISLKDQNESFQKPFEFFVYDNENGELILMNNRYQNVGSAPLFPPYYHREERVIILYKDKKAKAVCILKSQYVSGQPELKKMREITSLEAIDLIDTQYFVKMKPFVEIESQNEKTYKYVSELGLGKEKIYWKLNIISSKMLNFTIKDKDMFFDDLIGNAILPENSSLQKQQQTLEMVLHSTEQERKGGNGKIKIITNPIFVNMKAQQIKKIPESKTVDFFILRLGGIKADSQLMKSIDYIEISLHFGIQKCLLFAGIYQNDLLFYLQNKDLQIVADTAFLQSKETSISISLRNGQKEVLYQSLNLYEKVQKQSSPIFEICQKTPLQINTHGLTKLYCWLYEKIKEQIEVYFVSDQTMQKGHVLLQERHLLIIEPLQLFDIKNSRAYAIVLYNKKQLFRLKLNEVLKNGSNLSYGSIQTKRQGQIGRFYLQSNNYQSKGENLYRKVSLGKSRKQWLYLTVDEAFLNKDLEFFSKMDPYCKIALAKPKQSQEEWLQTSVQDNVGLHPIWNESFFIELLEKGQNENVKFVVMDSEVTLDRKIGDATMLLADLLKKQFKQIDVFYSEKEKAGRLVVKSLITTKYLIIRKISTARENKSDIFLCINQSNSRQKTKVVDGVCYPIVENGSITFICQDTQKKYTYKQLKQNTNSKVIFEDELIALNYELYE